LNICNPHEVKWKPPLRQAAVTLAAISGDSAVEGLVDSVLNNL
jgi:hypothetical protein